MRTPRDDVTTPAVRLRLAEALVARPGGVTVAEMMDRLGVSQRTAMRYLADLPRAGTPLESEWRGAQKVYSVRSRARGAVIPMTELEMVSVVVARETAAYLKGTPFHTGLEQVFTKIEASLKHKDRVANLARKIHDVNEGAIAFKKRDAEHLAEVIDALLREQRVEVRHERVEAGRVSFLLDPYTLLFHRKGPYLIGRSHHPAHGDGARSVRTFAFDGIRKLRWRRGDAFAYPPGYSPARHLRGAFGIVAGAVETIRIAFDRSAARSVRRRVWHRTQRIREREDGSILLEMRCAPSFEVKAWILGWGASAEVLEPERLRAEIAREVTAMRKRYPRGKAVTET